MPCRRDRAILLLLLSLSLLTPIAAQTARAGWSGVLRDSIGHPISKASVQLRSASHEYTESTAINGEFTFTQVMAGDYHLSVISAGKIFSLADPVTLSTATTLHTGLEISSNQQLRLLTSEASAATQASCGEHLSS